jgi:hypothetical protein
MAMVRGKWQWNEEIQVAYVDSSASVSFVSNGGQWTRIHVPTFAFDSVNGLEYINEQATDDEVYCDFASHLKQGDDTRFLTVKPEYSIMDFGETEQEVSENFYNYLVANATRSIAKMLTQIAENEQKVYDTGYNRGNADGHTEGYQKGYGDGKAEGIEEGKQAEYDTFWDIYQQNGDRNNYRFAFGGLGWTDETAKPKYPITRINDGYMMFSNCNIKDVAQIMPSVIISYAEYLFNNSNVVHIGEITLHDACRYTFSNCRVLETIDKFKFTGANGTVTFYGAFQNCSALKNIVLEGVIVNNIDFQWSAELSRASIENIIEHLSTETTGLKLTLSKAAVDKAYETSEGANDGSDNSVWFDDKLSYRPNWSISLA